MKRPWECHVSRAKVPFFLAWLGLALQPQLFAMPGIRLERRRALSATVSLLPAPAEAILRTTKETPELPQVLAVMLLRTTYDSVESWGVYSDMADYQKKFAVQLRDGFESFRGVTNRFYFSFLNDAQWRVIARAIRRGPDRERFSQLVGSRLYQSILRGEDIKSDVDMQGQEANLPSIGRWPQLAVSKGSDPTVLSSGTRQLLKYLKDIGYCKDFQVTDFASTGDAVKFVSFVFDPVNLDATVSLMRSNGGFAPRYDQRILQAYFADCGFSSTFEDTLAESIEVTSTSSRFVPKGVRTAWMLKPDNAS